MIAAAPRFKASLPPVTMRRLLELRKGVLEAQVAERFRQARASGTTANVKLLSATLRAVKRQIAAVSAQDVRAEG